MDSVLTVRFASWCQVNDNMGFDGCIPPVKDVCNNKAKAIRYSPTKCCPPNVIADSSTCTAANGVTTMKQCLEAICGKSNGILFGQCQAPPLGMWGGAFGCFTVVAAFVSVYWVGDISKGAKIACSVLAIVTTGLTVACFITSFYRWGSGNKDDRSNFDIDGNIIGADCNYTYSDSHDDYKTMTGFAAVVAAYSITVSVVSCLTQYQNEVLLDSRKSPRSRGLSTDMGDVSNSLM